MIKNCSINNDKKKTAYISPEPSKLLLILVNGLGLPCVPSAKCGIRDSVEELSYWDMIHVSGMFCNSKAGKGQVLKYACLEDKFNIKFELSD